MLQAGMSEGDQAVKKINFTLDSLIDKYENLHERLDQLISKNGVLFLWAKSSILICSQWIVCSKWQGLRERFSLKLADLTGHQRRR
jgi:hypothetical protein